MKDSSTHPGVGDCGPYGYRVQSSIVSFVVSSRMCWSADAKATIAAASRPAIDGRMVTVLVTPTWSFSPQESPRPPQPPHFSSLFFSSGVTTMAPFTIDHGMEAVAIAHPLHPPPPHSAGQLPPCLCLPAQVLPLLLHSHGHYNPLLPLAIPLYAIPPSSRGYCFSSSSSLP